MHVVLIGEPPYCHPQGANGYTRDVSYCINSTVYGKGAIDDGRCLSVVGQKNQMLERVRDVWRQGGKKNTVKRGTSGIVMDSTLEST